MQTNPAPSFPVLLDKIVGAFHLDHDEPELRGSGPFQHHLRGRRLDIKDESLRRLLRQFGSALLRSGVFPAIAESLKHGGRPGDKQVAHYLRGIPLFPPGGDDPAGAVEVRLAWLAEQHEALFAKARSRDPGEGSDARYALMPAMRFAWHHLTFALSGLLWCGLVRREDLDGRTPQMSWWMEAPESTPMRLACETAGITRGRLLLDLCQSDSGLTRSWDEKTLDNLWHGGPSHPTLETLEAVAGQLLPGDAEALARCRRWYGLRHLARQFAEVWGWEALNGCLATTLAHATGNHHDLGHSALDAAQRGAVGSAMVWAGWRPLIGRFVCESIARNAGDKVHPTVKADYKALGAGEEGLRIEECAAKLKDALQMERELRRRGRTAAEAREESFRLLWSAQGDLTHLADVDPVFALEGAFERQDWPTAERAARELVRLRPEYVANHFLLAGALSEQGRFDEAFAVLRDAGRRFPGSRDLARCEALALMLRGERTRSHGDFERARDGLLAMGLAAEDWELQLHLADCHFALGDWEAARNSCRVVCAGNDQCGEAFALEAICAGKLGERQAANKAGERAERRGAGELLAELRRRDAAGSLGSAVIRPVPRWHRLFVRRAPGAMPGLANG